MIASIVARASNRVRGARVLVAALLTLALTASVVGAQGFTTSFVGPLPGSAAPNGVSMKVDPLTGSIFLATSNANFRRTSYWTRISGVWFADSTSFSTLEANDVSLDVALPSGVPHLALVSAQGVTYATKDENGGWQFEQVLQTFGVTPYWPSIALDAGGTPWISVLDVNSWSLVLCHRLGPDNWSRPELIAPRWVNFNAPPVLRVTSYPSVVYSTPDSLVWTAKPYTTWQSENVAYQPAGFDYVMGSSGYAELAYVSSSSDLNYAIRLGANNWQSTPLRPAYYTPEAHTVSMTLCNGYPHIAYYSYGRDSVRYASMSKNGWNFQRVASLRNHYGSVSPLTIGVMPGTGTQILAKIAFANDAPDPNYSELLLSEGIATVRGNSSALPWVDDTNPPATPVVTRFGIQRVSAGFGSAQFALQLPRDATVGLDLIDVSGRVVASREGQSFSAGEHRIGWDLGSQTSGVYFLRMSERGVTLATTRCVVIR